MRIFAIPLVASALLFGQAAEPVKVTPGTPGVKAPAQAAPPTVSAAPAAPVTPDTVVLKVNGKDVTAAELNQMIGALPVQVQQIVRSQPQQLSQLFLMRYMAEEAEKAGVDKQSPLKEELEFTRLRALFNAQLTNTNNNIKVTEEDKKKYFKDNPDKFKEVKVKVIYIAFNPAPGKGAASGKQLPTEAEAQAKIEGLRRQILGGGLDFGQLARENSDDQSSAARDGDFGVLNRSSSYPEEMKKAVLDLKQGEVTAPIKQPNGYYLIRAEEITSQPYDDVQIQIITELRTERFQAWLKGVQSQYTVKVENPAYFTPRTAPAQLQQVH